MAFYFSNASSHPVKDKELYFLDARIEDIKLVTANKNLLNKYIATLRDPEAEDGEEC